MFLLVVDSYSKRLEVVLLSHARPLPTLDSLCSIFATHGLPKEFATDNGTQFTSVEFEEFMKNNGIGRVPKAPYHPVSNGLTDRAVQYVFQGQHEEVPYFPGEKSLGIFIPLWLVSHFTMGISPTQLLLGRISRSKFDLFKPDLSNAGTTEAIGTEKLS